MTVLRGPWKHELCTHKIHFLDWHYIVLLFFQYQIEKTINYFIPIPVIPPQYVESPKLSQFNFLNNKTYLRIPIRVKYDDSISSLQIYPNTTSTDAARSHMVTSTLSDESLCCSRWLLNNQELMKNLPRTKAKSTDSIHVQQTLELNALILHSLFIT